MENKAISTNEKVAARTLADYLAGLVASDSQSERVSYSHMGATLTDTVLQAGLNYRTVVLPRVRYLLNAHPEACTTTSFWNVLCDVGPYKLLRWSHPEKMDRLMRVVDLLRANAVETESELSEWLASIGPTEQLLAVRGIGPKTVDYLKILVGMPTVAVDRHVKALFKLLGLEYRDYEDFRLVVCLAADMLSVQPQVLDGIIWQHVSTIGTSGHRSHGIVRRDCQA